LISGFAVCSNADLRPESLFSLAIPESNDIGWPSFDSGLLMRRWHMNISTFRRAVVALAGITCVGAMAVAQAAPLTFTVPLSGTEQVPAVQTQGTGTANLTYDPDTRVVTWNVTFSGLSSPATMAHFHGPAPAGKNAPPVVWLSQRGSSAVSSPMTGQATLSSAQATEFLAGDMYINVHTKNHPDGELRGQVMPPKQ
jgi:hypothetical protein